MNKNVDITQNMTDKTIGDTMIRDAYNEVKVPEELEPQAIAELLKKDDTVKPVKTSPAIYLRYAAAAASVCLVFGLSAYFIGNRGSVGAGTSQAEFVPIPPDGPIESISKADDYDAVLASIQNAYSRPDYYYADNEYGLWDTITGFFSYNRKTNDATESLATAPSASAERSEAPIDTLGPENSVDSLSPVDSGKSEPDFSETINQVAGVYEADIIRTDGRNIYFMSSNAVYAMPVNNGKFGEVTTLITLGLKADSFIDMYLVDNRLCVISQRSDSAHVQIFSIADSEATEIGSYGQEGIYNTSRISDGHVYLITNAYVNDYDSIDPEDPTTFVPTYTTKESEPCTVPSDCIVVPSEIEVIQYTIVGAVSLENPTAPTSMQCVAGYSDTVYCSTDSIYVVTNEYSYSKYQTITTVCRFTYSDGSIVAGNYCTIDGTPINQFAMDEYDNSFRIAVTVPSLNESQLYVYDLDMKLIGSVGGLGLGEQIKSVNFDGETAYVVTFRQTDPLYAIDLSDKTHPVVTDELKITGFSSYMYNWSDGLLLGFGVEADPSSGRTNGIKLSMFKTDGDGSDTLDEIAKYSLLDSYSTFYYSNAISERKELFIDAERGLVAFPVECSSFSDAVYDEYGEYWTQESRSTETGYILLHYENGEFTEIGRISRTYFSSVSDDNQIDSLFNRCIRIDNELYFFANTFALSADLATMTEIDSVTLAPSGNADKAE